MDALNIAKLLTSSLIQNCPKDMRNLVRTIGFEVTEDGYRVFLGGDELLKVAKAPYAKFTNERPNIKYSRKGTVKSGQPLYKWIDRTIEQVRKVVEQS